MYNDSSNTRRSGAFFDGGDKDKCFPYSILAKTRLQQQQQQLVMPPSAATLVSGSNCYQNYPPAMPPDSPFYGNAMVTDVGICFSMSNVNLNSDFPPYLGHPSLSVLGRTTRNSSPPMPPPPHKPPRPAMPPPNQPTFKTRNIHLHRFQFPLLDAKILRLIGRRYDSQLYRRLFRRWLCRYRSGTDAVVLMV